MDLDQEQAHHYALRQMYRHGRGILSPGVYNERKTHFGWYGFAVGMFSSTLAVSLKTNWFNQSSHWWGMPVGLALVALASMLGIVAGGAYFESMFVEDSSLEDPLFNPYLR